MKSGELQKRREGREVASAKMEEAMDAGDMAEVKKQAQRNVKVTSDMIEDAKKLLTYMGVPIITAPGEAEAQCAALVTAGKAYGVASEDMDSLTFASKFLLRGFNSKKEPITEISYDEMMTGFGLTHEQFVDLSILSGCDYTCTIDNVGSGTAYKLIKEYGSIEGVI
jgi:flap endonuclease-1